MGDRFDKERAIVSRRRAWLLLPALAQPFALFALMPLVAHGPKGVWLWLASTVLGTLVTLYAATRYTRSPRRTEGRLSADAQGLLLDGARLVAREHVRSACTREEDGRLQVRLQGRFAGLDDLDVDVADQAEADALLTAMRLRGPLASTRYVMNSGTFGYAMSRFVGVLCLGLLAFESMVAWGGAAQWLALALAALAAVVTAVNGVVSVIAGADGLRVEPRFGRARFVAYARISSIDTDSANVRVNLRDGATLTLSFGASGVPRWAGGAEARDHVHGFVARVRERLAAHHDGSAEQVTSALARGGRETAEWVRAVRGATDGAASFRVPAVPADVLMSVVEDETAAPDSRVGAAVALRHAGLDGPMRERVRVAAVACAAPRLRVALEAAATAEDEDDVLDALDALTKKLERA